MYIRIHRIKRIKQTQKVYFDELILILFDTVDKSPGFFPKYPEF